MSDDEELDFMIQRFDNEHVDKIGITLGDQIKIFNWLKELALYRKLAGSLQEAAQINQNIGVICVNDSNDFRKAVSEAVSYMYTAHREVCTFPEMEIVNKVTGEKITALPTLCYQDITEY